MTAHRFYPTLLRLGLLLAPLLSGCEPYNLQRAAFPVCARPSAGIGVTSDGLDVTFFLDNPQGDIGAIGWNPGDGTGASRVGARVIYSYPRPGTYTVTLTLVNGCDDVFTTTRPITLR
ncbi:hypothetical protein GCM10027578_19140 [Spirosoma luteolum]